MYISYKHGKNFCEVRIQAKALWIWLDIYQADLNDPNELTRDVTNIGHYGTGHVDLKADFIFRYKQSDGFNRTILLANHLIDHAPQRSRYQGSIN
jgi:hypothetical protein